MIFSYFLAEIFTSLNSWLAFGHISIIGPLLFACLL